MLSKPLVLIRAKPPANGVGTAGAPLKGQRLEVIAIAPNEAWSANAGNWQLAYKALVIEGMHQRCATLRFVDVEDITELVSSGKYRLHVPLFTRVVRYVSMLTSKLF